MQNSNQPPKDGKVAFALIFFLFSFSLKTKNCKKMYLDDFYRFHFLENELLISENLEKKIKRYF